MSTSTVKPFEFTNTFMFSRVMSDESICRGVLESILGFEIGRIEYRNTEQELDPTLDGKGVKLDVFAKAGNKVFDVEMQAYHEHDLPRRARFYQSAIDTSELKKGSSYESLPDSYIIFICKDDHIGAGAARYDMKTACTNHPEADYEDGAHTIVLNASAWASSGDADPAGLLEYVATGADTGSELVGEIIRAVDDANNDREWVNRTMGFMTIEYALKCKQDALDATTAKLDATTAKLDAASAKLDAATAELDATAAELDATAAELDATAAELDATAAELDEANTKAECKDKLARALNDAGRGGEFFAAIDDPAMMNALLEEFDIK